MDFKYCKIRFYILSLFAIVFLASCSDSEDPFVGTDNYVTSFTLTKDEVNYTASISGEEIVLSAPENVSLDNATADVILSERATIYPAPSEIKDWNNEQIFIVTSFNGTDKTYRYKIAREGKAYIGDANLNSQADVDEFAKQGYNIVYGSLNIGEAISDAPITSLEGLRTLRKVTGNLKIGTAYTCDNISGLDNITSVGAFIVPSQNEHLIDLQLPGLEEIKANATITGSNIFNVSLPKLKKIGGSLIAQVPTKTFDLSALQEISCDLSYYVTAESVMNSLVFQSLQSVGGKISATMVLNAKEGSLTTLDMPSLIHCGALEMGKISTLSTLYVPRLSQVDEKFNIGSNNYIEASFPSLKKVGTWVVAMSGDELDLSGIEIDNLYVSGDIITGKTAKTIIGDESFGGNIEIEGAFFQTTSPLTLKGFTKIGSLTLGNFLKTFELLLPDTKIAEGNIDLGTTNKFTSNPFPAIEEVKGDFLTGKWQSWEEGSFEMADLKRVGGNFTLGFKSKEVAELKLPVLEEVGGNLELFTSSAMKTIEFASLKTVGGNLSVTPFSEPNTALENMNGFSNLIKVGGVKIVKHTKLVSFEGLKQTLPCLTEENWEVSDNGYNPTYAELQAGKWENNQL